MWLQWFQVSACKLLLLCALSYAQPGVSGQSATNSTLGRSNSSKQLDYVTSRYLSNAELEQHMREFSTRKGCAQISKMFSIGRSTDGTNLWALEISSNPGTKEPKPNFKYIGNLHGDEPTGRMLIMGLAEWLCVNWQSNESARRLVAESHLYLLPSANPDGFASKSRTNRQGVDLNRNFPDPIMDGFNLQPKGTEQPETLALMNWIQARHYVASASMHEGALVANYPWDGQVNGQSVPNITQDDATFQHLARSYARHNPKMQGSANAEFPSGITNGADWYPLMGGMQDWNYLVGKCMELTLELSLLKSPAETELPGIWRDNLDALVHFPLTAMFGGLRGSTISQAVGSNAISAVPANISILGSDWNITSDSDFGNFYRPLSPGTHKVLIHAEEHEPQIHTVVIPSDDSGLIANFTLLRARSPGRGLGSTGIHTMQSQKALPRKFGGSDIVESKMHLTEGEELLVSQEMWINMMQMAMYLVLGFVVTIFTTAACFAGLRRLSIMRSRRLS